MTAKEMFEKLDWVIESDDKDLIVYRQNAFRLTIYKHIYEFRMWYIDNHNIEHSGIIDMPLVSAIHQQMKELGWIK